MTAMIQEGDKAPVFKASTDTGDSVSLKDFRGKKIVLYFYPKDNTSGCTKEACDFRDNMQRVKRKGAVVLGISPDSEKSHQNFKSKHDLNFPLIVDSSKEIAEMYGVWKEKSMYGRKFMGIERSTFLIDEQGNVEKIWRKVKVSGHVDDVLASL